MPPPEKLKRKLLTPDADGDGRNVGESIRLKWVKLLNVKILHSSLFQSVIALKPVSKKNVSDDRDT